MSAEEEVSALRAEVEQLRTDLTEMRDQLAKEVRTRRVVVEDGHAVERVVLAVNENGTAVVEVVADWTPGGEVATAIELFALAPPGRPAEAGLVLTYEADVVASLDCLDGTTILNLP